MINENFFFFTVSWLSDLLSAEIFISIGEWGVQMPPLTAENRHFLRPLKTAIFCGQGLRRPW